MTFCRDESECTLACRRQFILAPGRLDSLIGWQYLKIAPSVHLHVHPDLVCKTARADHFSLTLLGYLTNPHLPDQTDDQILQSLIEGTQCGDNLFERTECLGGRWILILSTPMDTILFNDPAGLRQTCFTCTSELPLCCASQPGLIGEQLGLEPSTERAADFLEIQRRRDPEYWWPGDSSPYREITHLLPNHYLSLRRRTVHRFWPTGPIPALDAKETVQRVSMLLKGQISAIAKRFSLAMPITAGVDSRTIMAATKECSRDIYYYTLMYRIVQRLTEKSADVRIPSRLLRRLGLPHHIIRCPDEMDDQFKFKFNRNVATAHACWGNIIQGLHLEYPSTRVAIDGTCSEIARCFYYKNGKYPQEEITAEQLAQLTRMIPSEFVLARFGAWLKEAKVIEGMHGMRVLDLFYWEQRMGRWNAMAQQELDIAQESFTPFNHREILVALLGADVGLRCEPRYRIYRRIIRELWPEVLFQPINPVSLYVRARRVKGRIRRVVVRFLKAIGVYGGLHRLLRRSE